MTTGSDDTTADAFLGLGAATFKADGGFVTHNFTAQQVAENGANRIAPRNRPFRQGAKLDFVGSKADTYVLDCMWHPDVDEPDLNDGEARWPDAVQSFIDDLKTGATGTLNLPWKRGIRVKATEWSRVESAVEHRGGAIVRVTFVEDNEDSLDRQAVELVSVKATIGRQVEAAQFDMESEGMDLFAIADVVALAEDVVGLLNFPGDVAGALFTAGAALRRACKITLDAFSSGDDGRDQMNDPQGSSARRKLLELLELGARAVSEGRPRPTRVMTFQRVRDIWSIATEIDQKARDLMTINEQIEDFAFIPAATPVRVFA
jgi:hypothetical protein